MNETIPFYVLGLRVAEEPESRIMNDEERRWKQNGILLFNKLTKRISYLHPKSKVVSSAMKGRDLRQDMGITVTATKIADFMADLLASIWKAIIDF
ncbi:hypothetical protein L2E82_02476 [Cichorium intybus]|uniref:Uncharacterized protein n=1 Tax=Cichorium intybus TaxID=13427 RepID=A0ACB9H1Q1_CICIN|nr:hypothetical protein L2E82_02476 [Cichorium intybus]